MTGGAPARVPALGGARPDAASWYGSGHAGVAQLAERQPSKLHVAGSIPVSRSNPMSVLSTTRSRPSPCGRLPARRPSCTSGRSDAAADTVSELGVGMWGMGGGIGGWSGADDAASMVVLQAAVDAGVTFLDSAQVYGFGVTDRLMGEVRAANAGAT